MAADASTTSPQDSGQLLAQLLQLIQSNQAPGQAPSTETPKTLPNQSMNYAGQVFQLGANGQPTPENPGSSPDASMLDSNGQYVGKTAASLLNGGVAPSYWAGSLPTFGAQAPGNNQSVGGMSYGNAGTGGFVNNRQDYANYQSALNGIATQQNSNQFNQLLQGLLKQQQNQPAPAAALAPAAPPPPPPAVNNQVAYTDPTKAFAPGMGATAAGSSGNLPDSTNAPGGTLASSLQAGTLTPQQILSAGGPLTASTGSTLQMPASYNPGAATFPSTQQTVDQSGQATGGLGSAVSGIAQIPQTALQAYQRTQQLQGQGFGPASKSYSPRPDLQTPGGTTLDMGSVDAAQPMALNGANYAQGGLDAPSGVDASAIGTGGANYAAGGLDGPAGGMGADGSATVGGGGMSAGMGSALASGASAIGSALQKAYTPIKLGPIPQVQQPKPPVFTNPLMTADR